MQHDQENSINETVNATETEGVYCEAKHAEETVSGDAPSMISLVNIDDDADELEEVEEHDEDDVLEEKPQDLPEPESESVIGSESQEIQVSTEETNEVTRQAKLDKMNEQLRGFFQDNDQELINLLVVNLANLILRLTNFPQSVANSVQNAIVYHNHQHSQSEMTNIIISREAMDGPNLRVHFTGTSENQNDGFMGYLFRVFGAANTNETTVSSFSHEIQLRPLVNAHLVKQFQLLGAMPGETFSAYYSVSSMAPVYANKRLADANIPPVETPDPVDIVH